MQSIIQYRRLHRRNLEKQSRQLSAQREGQQHQPKQQPDSATNSTIEVTSNGDDSTAPQQWSIWHRTRAAVIVWLLVFTQGWVATCDSEATKPASKAFGVSETAETLTTAIFLLGISIGALLAGPLSETVGRNPVYLGPSLLLLVFTMGSALAPNFAASVVLRFLSGVASSSTLSMYGGSLGDLFTNDERRHIWPVFATSALLGPVAAPLAGGWIVQEVDWRWTLWVGLIFAGVAFLIALLFLPETFAPELLRWKAQHLRAVTGDDRYLAPIEAAAPLQQRVRENLARPFVFFTKELIVIFSGLYLTLIFVVNFSFLNGLDFILSTDSPYRLSTGLASLNFAAIILGVLIDVGTTPLCNRLASRVHRKHCRAFVKEKTTSDSSDSDTEAGPTASDSTTLPSELFLIRAAIAAPFLPASLFWLAWTNYPSISPAPAYAATVVFGYAFSAIFVSIYQYVIDSYGAQASSALAGITTVRYVVSAGMIVATRPMYNGIGVHWSLTILAGLATVLVPVPWYLVRYGHLVRARSQYAQKG